MKRIDFLLGKAQAPSFNVWGIRQRGATQHGEKGHRLMFHFSGSRH